MFDLTKLHIVVFLIPPFGINPLLKLIESSCVSPTVISFGCRKVKICFFFPESVVGVGVTTGAGVGDGVTTGAGVGDGVTVGAGDGAFLTKDVNVGPTRSHEPGSQNLQRSVVPVGTSIAAQG